MGAQQSSALAFSNHPWQHAALLETPEEENVPSGLQEVDFSSQTALCPACQ